MKAAVQERYGPPEVVEVRDVDRPVPKDGEVLVRVHAASINRADLDALKPRPRFVRLLVGLRAPRNIRTGIDVAGVVESVGAGVTAFKPGDEVIGDVYGAEHGAFAEYVTARERSFATVPPGMSMEAAATLPHSAVLALQALRLRNGRTIKAGDRVLIDGASGSVGPFAVQIAKALGAEVTAVCSTPNVEIARSLGADLVIDYRVEEFTRRSERYHLVLDIAGTRSFSELRRVLEPGATVVVVGGPRANRLLGPLGHVVGSRLRAIRGSQRATFFVATFNKEDMETLRELMESGKLTSVIDSTYPLDEIAGALQHMGEGHPRGKILITV